jgi:hypothetical protein
MARTKPIGRRTSPLLAQVTHAVAQHEKLGPNSVPGNLPAAITELSALAAVSVIARGVVASEEFRTAVDDIASRYLGGAAAERRLTLALMQIDDLPTRNAVEIAHAQVVDLRELAHYYAGLASGVSIVELGRR